MNGRTDGGVRTAGCCVALKRDGPSSHGKTWRGLEGTPLGEDATCCVILTTRRSGDHGETRGGGGVKGGADGAPRVFRAETPCCLVSQGAEGRGPHTSVQTLKTHGGPRGRRRTWLNGTSTGAASSTAADVLKAFKLLKNLNDRLKQMPHQTQPPCPRAAAWAGPAPPTRQTAVRNRTELKFASQCLHGHETEGVSIKRVCEEMAWPFSHLSPLPA